MPRQRNIKVWGKQRADIDPELMAQVVMMLGRQLAQEAMTDDAVDGSKEPESPEAPTLPSPAPSDGAPE